MPGDFVRSAIPFSEVINCGLFETILNVWENGRMANGQMTNYIIPTAADIPPIRVFFEENPYAYGPAGAKGIGELPMDGPAPAILMRLRMRPVKASNRFL